MEKKIKCRDCRKPRPESALRTCFSCDDAGPYCNKCGECKKCTQDLPGDWRCEVGYESHEFAPGDTQRFICVDCDCVNDAWRVCPKHVRHCSECNDVLCSNEFKHTCCWRSDDDEEGCEVRVCIKCGYVPRTTEGLPVCAAHRPQMRERYVEEVLGEMSQDMVQMFLKKIKR